MAIKLASLGVELTLNAAQFVTGFEASKKAVTGFTKDVGSSLSEVGNVASLALGQLGAMGGEVGATLSSVGQAATSAFSAFGKIGGPIGTLAGVGAAAAVGMGAASIAVIGIAIHAAEAAAKLADFSHMTGVSVEALSKLQLVGHMIAPDVGIDVIVKSLDRMDRAMLKAATSATTTTTPFQRMGIAVKDAGGQLRPTEEVFADIADKFSKMPDGAAKTGLAMEIFGRGGAALIPILDEGGKRIKDIIDLGTQLGVVIGTQTAEAAHKFKENLSTVELVFQGIENKIMEGMLPAMTTLSDRLISFFRESTPEREKFIHDLTDMATAFLKLGVAAGEGLRMVANNLGAIVDVMEIFSHGERSLGTVLDQAGHRTLQWVTDTVDIAKGIPAAMSLGGGPKTPFDQLDDMKDRLRDFDKLHHPPGIDLQSDAAKRAELTIQEQIAKLEGQAEAEGLLANAISSVSSATIQATAHAEALKTITTLNVQAAKQHVSVTAAQAQQIEIATQRLDAYKAALSINKELEAQTQKVRASTAALIELAAAYSKGGAAVLGAQEQSKLAPLSDKVGNLQEVFDTLRQKPVTGKLAEELRVLGTSLDQAKAKLQEAASSLHEEDLAKYTAEIAKEQSAVAGALPFLKRLNSAYLESEEAVREAKVALELYNFEVAHPGVPTDQVEGQRQILEQQSRQAHDAQIAQEAGQFSLQRILSDTNARYAAIKETIQSMGQSSLLVDAAIYDSNVRIIKQWDDAAFKVGTLKEKFTGFFNELVLQGQNLGAKVFGSMLQAVDSLENELAKLLTGEKTNFGAIGKQLEQSIIKAQMQAVIGQAAGALDKLFPGLHAGDLLKGKPDGTESNPLNVKVINGSGLFGGSSSGPSGDVLSSIGLNKAPGGLFGGLLGKIFGGGEIAGTGQTASELKNIGYSDEEIAMLGGGKSGVGGLLGKVFGGLFSGEGGKSILSGIGGAFSKILGMFGGGMADGGDMDPGKWYVTGERHPEIIAPKRPMSVYASMPRMTGTYGAEGGGGSPQFHFHEVQNMDTFKRNKGQMAAWQQQTTYAAHLRHS